MKYNGNTKTTKITTDKNGEIVSKQKEITIDWSDMTDKDKEKLLDKNNNSEITKQFNKETKDVFDELDREIIKKYLK